MDNFLGSIIILIIFSIFYIPFVWWLYTINKKLGEKNPWLSFFPILQYYSIIKAAWKSLWWLLWIPLIWLWVYIIIIIIWWILVALSYYSWDVDYFIDLFYNKTSTFIILAFILYFFLILSLNTGYIIVLHWISKRTNRWLWTTIWFFFIPYIMFPVVAYKLKDQSTLSNSNDLEKEKQKIIEL